MKKILHLVVIPSIVLMSAFAQAAKESYPELRQIIAKSFPGAEVGTIKKSALPGIMEFSMGAQVLYVSKDGQYLIQGNIYDLLSQVNLTDESEKVARKSTLEKFGENNMLNYVPKKQKHFITVFTDVDCPYCRRLHDEVKQYMDNGIAVRYLFLPFKGQKSLDTSVSIWCSKDQQQAMTDAKTGKTVPAASCDNPIKQHMQLGKEFGIRGTPAIVLDSGEMIPGYRPAKDVIKMLDTGK